MIANGDEVVVSGRGGTVSAVVLDVRCIEDLPDVPLLEATRARALLLGGMFQRAAILGYDLLTGGNESIPVMFVALEDGAGLWWDLYGQNLEIYPPVNSARSSK